MNSTIGKSDTLREISSHTRFSSRHAAVFALCAALFFLSQFYRTSNAVIAPQLQEDLSLSPEKLGIVSASFFYAFAVMQIPLALYLDRLGGRLIMTLLTLVGSLGSVIFALSGGLYGATTGRVLLGIGMAGNLMGGMKLLTGWFSPREFATLAGLLVGAGTLGNAASSAPLALLAEAAGWRLSFAATGVVTAALAVFFFAVVRDAPHPASKAAAGPSRAPLNAGRIRVLLSSRDYWLISCGSFFRYGSLMGILALWAGPYLMECFRLSPVQAGNTIMASTFGYVAGCSMGGWLSDRVLASRKKVAVIGLAGMAAASLVLTFSWGQGNAFVRTATFFSLGLFSGFGNVMYAHIKGIMPQEMAGMALTGINFFTMLGPGFFIYVMGWVMECLPHGQSAGPEGYRAAFFLTFAGVALATVLYAFTRDSKEFRKEPS